MNFSVTTFCQHVEDNWLGNLAHSMASAVHAGHAVQPFQSMPDLVRWLNAAFVAPFVEVHFTPETDTVKVYYKQRLMIVAQQVYQAA